MLRYTSKPDRLAAAVALALLELPALAVLLLTLWQSAELMLTFLPGVLLISGMGLYLGLRLQLTEFTYEISDAETPGSFDLTVSSRCGRRIRTECRVRVAGCIRRTKEPHSRVIRYCPLFCEGSPRYFYADELPEGQCLLMRADRDFYEKMKLLGCETDE